MAADQHKRRLSTASTSFGYGLQEHNRAKKRDLKSSKFDFDFNTHVSLKWDDNDKRVVAKEDQIGISWRQLAPFISSAPSGKTKLADVVTVPRDVFDLKDMSDVLSNEVWQSVLTEKERTLLVQFLPTGVEADKAVEALFSGENFHFGNPFLKWGSSLCSGDLHPDAILQREKSFKANKKAYYSELQQYHDNMIKDLQNIKQRCANSKDPEAEIRQVTSSRLRRHEMSNFPDANAPKSHKPDDNVAVMSETLLSVADEKVYYSDNQKLSAIRDAEIQKRIRNQVHMKDKHEKLAIPPNGLKALSRPKKAEKLQKPNLTPNDGAKYMSYVKISKKKYDIIKSMKQSGSSIQSKALHRLIGGFDSSSVKPYEMFVKEEQNRIHKYWLTLANRDVPAAVQNWRNRQLTKQQIIESLWHEMEEKVGFQSKDENMFNNSDAEPARVRDENEECSQGTSEDNHEDESASQNSASDNDQEGFDTHSSKNKSPLQNPPLSVNKEYNPSSYKEDPLQDCPLNVNEESDPTFSMETRSLPDPPLNVKEECDPSSSMETQSLQNLPPLNSYKDSDPSSSMETQSLQNPSRIVKEEFDTSSSIQNQLMQHPINVNEELGPSCSESLQNPSSNVNKSFDLSPAENKCSFDHPPLNDKENFTPMDLNAENKPVTSDTSDTCSMPEQHVAQTSETSLRISHPGTCISPVASVVGEISGSSLKNMWTSIGLPDSFHTHPTSMHTNTIGLGLRHPQVVTEPPAHLIDLESDMPGEDTTKDLLNRHTSHMPFFNPYPNRDRNELLHSVIKPDNFHQEQKKPGVAFHPSGVLLQSAGQFPNHFREQLQPPFAVDHHHRQKAAQSNLFMHQNIPDSIYPDKNRYSSIQGPEHFSSINARDWSNGRLSNPIQPSQLSSGVSNPIHPSQLSSGELLNHNWFPTDNRAHIGWSTSDSTVFPAPSLPSGSTSDQSLYSVLTQCNLRSRGPYSPVGSAEQMIPPTTYGPDMAGGVIPMTTNALPPTVSPFNYLSGGEASTTLKNPSMGWMSLGHQPSTLRDPSGKPFLKSWNQ